MDAIDYSRERILSAELRTFGVPYFVVDDLFPVETLERINSRWPSRSIFQPEIPGIHITFDATENQTGETLAFWNGMAGTYWPAIMGACAERVSHITRRTHYGLPHENLALALMEADENFAGHGRHQHFYHNPNWVLTALFYADTDDALSPGTTLSRLNDGDPTEIALRTLRWEAGVSFSDIDIGYRPNRLLVFLDGPLAFHSVKISRPQTTRRRIMRTHISVNWDSFVRASGLMEIEHGAYTQLMRGEDKPGFLARFTRLQIAARESAMADAV